MGDADRKMKGTAGVTMFTPLVRTAAKPYTCDGCGECPISPVFYSEVWFDASQ